MVDVYLGLESPLTSRGQSGSIDAIRSADARRGARKRTGGAVQAPIHGRRRGGPSRRAEAMHPDRSSTEPLTIDCPLQETMRPHRFQPASAVSIHPAQ